MFPEDDPLPMFTALMVGFSFLITLGLTIASIYRFG